MKEKPSLKHQKSEGWKFKRVDIGPLASKIKMNSRISLK